MGRPRTIDDQEILNAARAVFLEKGAAGSTEEVAERAGISQASIFKRFKTKADLFLSAMAAERDRQDWVGLLERRSEEVGPRQAMVEIGTKVITFMRPILPMVLMSWSNRGEFGFHRGADRLGQRVAAVFETQIKAGRLRKHDPALVARVFVGAMQSYVLMGLVGPKNFWGSEIKAEDYVRGIVELLWTGLAPEGSADPSDKGGSR